MNFRSIFLAFIILMLTLVNALANADNLSLERKDVQDFIQQMVKKDNFTKKQLEALFAQVKIRAQVIRHIKKPLESTPWHVYQRLFISEWRIQHGVKFWKKYQSALEKAEKIYGVPASIIVATIGIETKYGQVTGNYRVIDSLSTIGFSDSPRAAFFRKELKEFLLLTREQHLDPLTVMGSYAGAIGQPQFMPSSYRYSAVNFSNSGKIDLMHDEVDVIGSIANYYKKHGWKTDQTVAVPAAVMGDRFRYYQYANKSNASRKSIPTSKLGRYGIVPRVKISDNDNTVQVIELQNRYTKEYWLGLHNFAVIKRYNPSDLYAMSVFQLSHYIEALKERSNNG